MNEAERIGAVYRLSSMTKVHPDLRRAEAKARLELAAAIMAMDAVDPSPTRHNMHEQVAVEMATHAYSQALANLLRGEEPDGDQG